MMKTVGFTRMADGTAADYQILLDSEKEFVQTQSDRLLATLRDLDHSYGGYQVSRLEHSLQSATRAYRNGESDEMVVATLFHDIGDLLAFHNHSEFAAAVLKPYVSERTHWIVKHHGLFQMYYYAHHYGGDRHERDRYRNHPYYQATVDFCEHYDQNSFDPAYDSLPLAFFEPMVRRIFAEPRQDK